MQSKCYSFKNSRLKTNFKLNEVFISQPVDPFKLSLNKKELQNKLQLFDNQWRISESNR